MEPNGAGVKRRQTLLSSLPHNHTLRNKPLSGAFYNMNGGKALFEVKDTFKIAKVSYNDLGEAWTKYSEFHYGPETP
jgi:hypothetical protein